MPLHMKNKALKQVNHQVQSGRSMVEMLGVLAVIGVLSIGGIAGYKSAMNHYQANQIAHEINLMNHDIQTKIAQGFNNLILGDPYDNSENYGHLKYNEEYEVDFGCVVENDIESCTEGYFIELFGLPENICFPLEKLLANMNHMQEVITNDHKGCQGNDNNLLLIFANKDLGGTTPNNKVCENCLGHCTKNNQCIECQENETWDTVTEQCVTECSTNGDCVDNKACCDGYYCHILPSGNTDGSTGTCTKIGAVTRGKIRAEKLYGAINLTAGQTWWNACRWCEAAAPGHQSGADCKNNRTNHMFDWHDINWRCYQDEQAPNPPYDTTSKYCKKDGGYMDQSTDPTNKSVSIQNLSNIFSNRVYVWLKTVPNTNNSFVYFISLWNGLVTYGTRNRDARDYIPLCR